MFNEKKFNDLFYQIVKNESVQNDNFFHENTKIESIKKYLSAVDSLNHCILNINSIVLNMLNDEDFAVNEVIEKDIDNIYIICENLRVNMAKFLTSSIFDMYNDLLPEERELNTDEQ